MDKYVKRLTRDEVEQERKAKRPRLRQATLQSLKGVIDVKRVLIIKEKLACKYSTEKQILQCLKEIQSGQTLPVQILTETGIGRVIGPLRKHSNETIASSAKSLVDQWKAMIQDLPIAPVLNKDQNKKLSLLVQTSGANDDVRKRAVDMFRANMSGSGNDKVDSEKAKEWEKAIYVQNDMKIDKEYKTKVRRKVFELKKGSCSSSYNDS
ncbi:hypothetical protein ACHWQZ_G005896 [Mnemiopsis leidyi]